MEERSQSKGGLDRSAYEPLPEGQSYRPYIPASQAIPEFSLKAVLAGALFGIVFGAANAYLGLRAGLTISTSIPVAVMTVAVFRVARALGSRNTILESNISQTVGSASSSLASGVIFTLPALFLWGVDPPLIQMSLLALLGGLIGTLMMIPLRSFLIAKEHGHLPYPEGTACAQVLVASEVGGGGARKVFQGLAAGMVTKLLTGGLRVIPGSLEVPVPVLPKSQLGTDISAALLGVGYILGPRVGAIMVGGGLLAWLVIIPALAVWGEGRTVPLYPETVQLISDMSPGALWNRYVRYIGAGSVAAAGLITLVRSFPTMVESFRVGARQIRARLGAGSVEILRTQTDLNLKTVGLGLGLAFLVMASPLGEIAFGLGFVARLVAAALIILFAFFFVTVSSRIVGLVGVTSNPTSGMTIATLLGTAGIFLALGWTDLSGKAAALCIGCVVAIAASIAGDVSQDLKTGFLLGATPRRQQTGEIIGVLTSAVFVCLAVLLLDSAYGFGTSELPAPQATLMKVVIEGVLDASLPWALVAIGASLTVIIELFKIPSLPFAVGVYLPITTTAPVFIGGMVRWWLERTSPSKEEKEERRERGILLGSGMVGGEGLLGVGIAAVAFWQGRAPEGLGLEWAGGFGEWIGLAALGLLMAYLVRQCLR